MSSRTRVVDRTDTHVEEIAAAAPSIDLDH